MMNHRIVESCRLEKTFESSHKPNTTKSTTKPCHEAPHPTAF